MGDLRKNTRNSIGRFAMGAIWNEGELQWGQFEGKHTQQHRANCNMGELHHILRCASSRTLPLHVCFLDVRKYVNTQKTSWAWYEYVCARCRGELQFALVAIRPYRELCFQVLKIVKINTINKIKPINNEKIFIFAL